MRTLAIAVLLAGCGRISFDDVSTRGDGGGSGSGDAGSDGGISTGPKGPRWATRYTNAYSRLAGANGQLAMVASYSGTFAVDDVPQFTGAGFTNSAVVRWNADGTVLGSALFQNDGFCDMRGLAVDGPDLVIAGFAISSNALPAYGPCGVLASRQQPVILRLDAANQQSLVDQWTAGGSNGQGWNIVRLADGTFANAGIYGQNLTVGTFVLPAAVTDPSMWIGRTNGGMNGAAWAHEITANVSIQPGPLAADGNEVCALGSYSQAATILGTALPFAGGNTDVFVARLDPAGTPKFVRAIGSTGDESGYNDGSTIALPDGGCMVGIDAPGDVTLDSVVYPASAGTGLAVRFSASGAVMSARRFQSDIYVTAVGSRLIGSYRVDTPLMIGSTMFTPAGKDVVIVELGATPADDVLLGTIGGDGDQDAFGLVSVGPDAVGFIVASTGGASFGSTALDTGAGARITGVLGI